MDITDSSDLLPYIVPPEVAQPVVRIPVAGPHPHNTLAIIRAPVLWGIMYGADGELYRDTVVVPTPLKLRGYDPLRDAQQSVQHSSTGCIMSMRVDPNSDIHIGDWNTSFTIAIDEILPTAIISSSGRVSLSATIAAQVHWRPNNFVLWLSSWILCWEPPDPDGQDPINPHLTIPGVDASDLFPDG